MGNYITIESIHIKNFRSIRSLTINLSKMNIFVGLNDVGKSNVLKALNLFFNNNTDYDAEYDFNKDFTYLFPKKSHSAKEIVIELKVEIPPSFQNSGLYIWEKTWRKGEDVQEKIVNSKGERPSSRSRIPFTLKQRIKFRYVPAVKSKDYYKFLLSELYITAAAALNNPLVESTKEFAGVIQSYTKQIHNEVADKIGIESQLTIPADMTDMFKTLIFMTGKKDEDFAIPLDMRGDGIQSRHIPIVLKYLADEDQKARNKGSVKVTSIWGYEEPENGIELLKSFEVAKSFLEYSQEIQMFVSTHSPAFYHLGENKDAKVFFVKKNEANETAISDSIDTKEISQSMGLMPLVTPYIAEKERQLKQLVEIANKSLMADVPTIFVEGITDKCYLEMAISLFSPKLKEKIETGQLRVFSEEGTGGCNQVTEWVRAWVCKGNKSKTIAIYDRDEAGKKAHKELVDSSEFKKSQNNKAMFLTPNDDMISIYNKKIEFEFSIEHLLSVELWKVIIENGYAVERSPQELSKMLGKGMRRDATLSTIYEEKIPNERIRETIVYYLPEKDSKINILNLVKTATEEKRKEYLRGFDCLLRELEKRFCN